MISLVTGAAGFIGSHVCTALMREGHQVVGVDDLIAGELSNLYTILDDDRFRFVEADVSERLPQLERIDMIFHFALHSSATERCCEIAARHRARILYAPPSAIDEEKRRSGEALLAEYRRSAGLDGRIVRIFNAYGPLMRGNDGCFVPTLIGEALAGQPLTILGDGKQKHSLCYIDDVIEAILRFSAIDDPAHRIVDIGNDEEVTVLKIARTISDLCGVPLRVRQEPLPEKNLPSRRPDLTQARTLLRWSAQTPLSDGLSRTVAWFRKAVFA